jgi:large repetitive protein
VRRVTLLAFLTASGVPFAGAQISNSSLNQWTLAAAMNAPRSQACSAILKNGSLLVAGGVGSSGPLNTAEIYGADGTFSVTTAMNQARMGAACATLLDGRVLAIGGDDGKGALSTAEIFDPVQQTWTPTGNLAVAREGHQAVVNGWGGVWVAGGTNASGIAGTLEVYDPSPGTFRTLGTLNTPRTDFAMVPLPHARVMLAGGSNGTSAIASVEICNQFGVVSAAGSLAQARQDFAAAALPDGTILVTGGKDLNGNLLNSTEIFDPVAGVSSAGPNLLTARAYHAAYGLANNGAVVIAGGTGGSGVLSSTETYSPWTGAIAQSAPMNSSRQNNVSAILRPGSLLVAGGRNATGPLSSSESFQYVTIATDRPDYAPGTPVNISGGGWQPGEQVAVQIMATPVDRHQIEFTGSGIADGSGNVTITGFAVDRSHLGMKFILTATGNQFQAQTSFTDGIDPTVSFSFSPPTTATPGTAIQVTVTFSGLNGSPLGVFQPCLNDTCGANNVSNTGSCVSTSLSAVYTLPGGSPDSCTFQINSIPAGTTAVGVFYVDTVDSNYNQTTSSSDDVDYTVQSATTTTMTSGPTGAQSYGTITPYLATVTTGGNSPSGQVQFLVNGSATYNSGTAIAPLVSLVAANPQTNPLSFKASWIPSPPLAVGGPYLITAGFVGDAANATSTSANSISTTISAVNTTTSVVLSTNPIVYGQPLMVSGTVTPAAGGGTPTGTVTVNGISGTTGCSGLTLSAGAYSCTVTPPGPTAVGSPYSVTATYTPAVAGYNASTTASAVVLVVNSASATVTVPGLASASGTSFVFSSIVTAVSPSVAVPAGNVQFYYQSGSATANSVACSPGTALGSAASVNSNTGLATSASLTFPTSGTYTVCAVYTPASVNFLAATSTSPGLTVASPSAGVATALQAPTGNPDPATFPASVTITGTIGASSGIAFPTGTLIFFDGTTNPAVQIGSQTISQGLAAPVGTASIAVSNLTGGTHPIYTTYLSSNGDFAPPSPNQSLSGYIVINLDTAAFTVSSGAPNPVAPSGSLGVSSSVTLMATYTGRPLPAPTGTISFINTAAGNAAIVGCTGISLTSGTATCTVATGSGNNLPVGSQSISITYSGDTNYNTTPAVTQFAFSVIKASTSTQLTVSPNPATVGAVLTLTAIVTVTGTSIVPTGTVMFTLGGNTPLSTTCGGNKALSGPPPYSVSCQIELSGPGGASPIGVPITYSAAYSGDVNTFPSNPSTLGDSGAAASLTSIKAAETPQLTLSPPSLVSGQSLTLTVVVPGAGSPPVTPTGTITLTGNGINITLPLVNGAVTLSTGLNLAALGAGEYNIAAAYSGDSNYVPAGSSISFTIAKDSVTVTLSTVNNATVITVTANAPGTGTPTGTITVYSGASQSGSPVAAGTFVNGSFTTALPSGPYFLVYSGDPDFYGISSTAMSVRPPPTTTVTLTASVNPVPANQPVVLTAFINTTGSTNQATGTVTFTDNGVLLGTASLVNGQATISTTLPVGNNAIVATYAGDGTYGGSSATIGLTVVKPAATVTASSNSTVTVFGQTVTLTARVTTTTGPAPTGTVQFFDGSTLLGSAPVVNGIATLTLSNLATGINNLIVVYSGDNNYTSSSGGAGSVTVNKALILTTATAATNNGQETVTATVAVVAPGSGTPTGTVQFIDTITGQVVGTAALVGGVASITIPVTTDPIMAVYSGDGNFSSSTAANVSAISAVNAASYALNYAADEIVSVFGRALTTQTLSATQPLPSTLGGVTVTLTDSAGITRTAVLFYVSPAQMSFLIPAATANGPATITVTTAAGSFTDAVTVTTFAAGLFTANANGTGPLSAQVVTVTPNGTQTYSNTAALSGTAFVNAPIALAPAADAFYLLLYGTGFDEATVSSLTVTINGSTLTPTYVGPQGFYAGLDQINVLLPANLAGSGAVNVSISVNGTVSNTGTIAFQ